MTTFKANPKTEVYYLIGSLLLLTVFIILSKGFSTQLVPYLFGLLLIIIFVNLFSFRINTIQLDKSSDQLTLIRKNFIGSEKAYNYNLTKVEFTYKQQATSFRGHIKNVCSIYYADKIVAQLIPDNDGWKNSEIKNFATELAGSNVKKKFVGYNLKDADI